MIRETVLERLLEKLNENPEEFRVEGIDFFKHIGLSFCPPQEAFFNDIYNEKVFRAAVLAPRGGGKTMLAAALASACFLFKGWDVVWCAASETQALYGFEYISKFLSEPEVQDYTLTQLKTIARGKRGNWIRALPASPRSIRGVHGGDKNRGAILIVDEEAEVDSDILRSALRTVNTGNPSVIVRLSTAHKAIGTFSDLLDHADELGYRIYSWDAFDVCKFEGDTPDFHGLLLDYFKDYNKPDKDDILDSAIKELDAFWERKKRKKIDGWIPLMDIVRAYFELPKEWFLVEVMAERAVGEGAVIQKHLIDLAIQSAQTDFAPDVVIMGIDWGYVGMTAIVIVGIKDGIWHVLETKSFTRQLLKPIIQYIQSVVSKWNITSIYADSSHQFENAQLKTEGLPLKEIKFVSYKEMGVGRLQWLFENKRIRIHVSQSELIRQLTSWHRDRSGKIVKKDDHFPDALLCTTAFFDSIGMDAIGIRIRANIFEIERIRPWTSNIHPWVLK